MFDNHVVVVVIGFFVVYGLCYFTIHSLPVHPLKFLFIKLIENAVYLIFSCSVFEHEFAAQNSQGATWIGINPKQWLLIIHYHT